MATSRGKCGCLVLFLVLILLAGLAAIIWLGFPTVSNLLTRGPNSLFSFGGVQGSGQPVTENRSVSDFSKIEVDNSAQVDVTIDPVASVSVTADDNIVPLVETKVSGDVLQLRTLKAYNSKLGIKIQIKTPSLRSLSITGASSVHVGGLDAQSFALNISGFGNVTLKGSSSTLNVSIDGAGDVQAGELLAHDVHVAVAGTGSVVVYADHSLDAAIAGAGTVSYYGHPPQVKQQIVGVGTVSPR